MTINCLIYKKDTVLHFVYTQLNFFPLYVKKNATTIAEETFQYLKLTVQIGKLAIFLTYIKIQLMSTFYFLALNSSSKLCHYRTMVICTEVLIIYTCTTFCTCLICYNKCQRKDQSIEKFRSDFFCEKDLTNILYLITEHEYHEYCFILCKHCKVYGSTARHTSNHMPSTPKWCIITAYINCSM